MSVPSLRFKDDEGVIFAEWQERSFKDISKINQGLQIPISDRFTEGGKNRHFYITNEFLRKDAKNQYFIENPPSSVLCSESDVLMTRTGNTGKVVTNVNGAFHNNFFKIGYDKNILHKGFLCEFLCLEQTQSLILKLAGTSTIPDLNHSDFYKINIRFPSLPEQTKIANFLSAIDEKITQLTQKHDLLTQYKKGVMQKIFSQELRFKDDDGRDFPEWEEKTLGDISIKKSSNIAANKIEENEGDYIIYGASGVLKKVDFFTQNLAYISIVKDGAGVGRVFLCEPKTSVLGTMDIIQPKENVDISFLYAVLEQIDFVIYVTGSTIPHIYYKDYSKEEVSVPSLKEQTKIANFLSAIDDKITATHTQLQAVKQYKQGLLQQMFV